MISTRPMRVAYVVHTFHMGGLERCVARLVNRLDRSRFAPIIICLNRNDDAATWLERDDVPVLEIHKRPGNDPRAVWRLAKLLRERQVDLVHSHNWGTLVETAVARRLAHVPWHIHAERGMELEDLNVAGWKQRLRDRVKAYAMRSATSVIAVSESIRERLAHTGVMPTERVRVIPNGVELTGGEASAAVVGRHIRAELGIASHSVVVGSVGRLAPVKDFGTVIDAVSRVTGFGRDVHLVIVGDGPERERLEERCQAMGLQGRCHLVGQQTDIRSWLSAIDVYVNSSLNEGMSQSILEAMAAGLPLVVTDVGDSATLVDGSAACGLVVPSGNPAALAEALDVLVGDEQRRTEMATYAVERHASKYDTRSMLNTYEQFYSELSCGI